MKRVLLIDDDRAVNKTISAFLRSLGWEVVSTSDSREAGALFRATPMDVVISDLVMPHRDGLEVLTEIRSLDPDVPVIMLTGFATMEKCREALRCGATDFLPKTCHPDELVAALERAMGIRAETLELASISTMQEAQIEIRLPALIKSKVAVIRRVLGAAREAGYGKKSWSIRLALDEAFTNAVKHGAHEDAEQSIIVRAQFNSAKGSVIVKDSGKGFDPERLPDRARHEPGGRGIFLIRSFSDEAHWTDQGATVEMVFVRPAEPVGLSDGGETMATA